MNRAAIIAANPLREFLAARGVKLSANGTRADRCPAKQHTRNDTVSIDPEKQVWNCHACGTGGSVVDWLAQERSICVAAAMRELGGTNGNGEHAPTRNGGGKRIVAEYSYTDEAGKLLYQCVRYMPKTFRQRRPDPAKPGAWLWNLKNCRLVPYRLPEVLKAGEVWIPEGELDCDTLAGLGFVATCNPMGAGKWRVEYNDTLRGKSVVIIPDNDRPGQEHAEKVARSLHGVAASVKIVALPSELNGHAVKDATDFVRAVGYSAKAAAGLRELIARATPYAPTITTPPATVGDPGDIHKAIIATLADGNLKPTEKAEGIAALVVEALCQRGRFYYNADLRDFSSAMFFDAESKQLLRIQSDLFNSWLSLWLGINRNNNVFSYIASAIESAALSGPNTTAILPESFWASRPDAFYISNGDGQAVRITPGKFEIVDNGNDGVLFAAGQTLRPWNLTQPLDPFATCSLFASASYSAKHSGQLVKLWTVSLPTNPPNKPPLGFFGEIGSGKTANVRGIAELYGLDFAAGKVERDGERDFWSAINAGGLYCLDNADTKTDWLADCIANAATGGCSIRRRLYTDSDKITQRARAWLGMTSANPTFANDSGLADRLLVVRMLRREGNTNDAGLYAEIARTRDAGLSWIVRTLATALAETGATPPGLNSRHPDFAAFAVKIGRALGEEAESIAALSAAEGDKSRFCLENDSLGAALLAMLEDGESFSGTAATLLDALAEKDGEFSESNTDRNGRRYWSAKRIGKRLASLWPHLSAISKATRERDSHTKNQFFTIKPKVDCGVCGVSLLETPKVLAALSRERFSRIEETNTANTARQPEPEAATSDTLRV